MTATLDAPRPNRDDRIRLRDGRRLAYAEFGDPAGRPVLWFHGTPGARWQLPPRAPRVARQRGFRLISVDRPGIGGSSPHPGRSLLSWANDIEELVDALDVPRFAAIGLSGGGPYVLACAHELADRVVVGVSLGGVGPIEGEPGAPGYPWYLRALLRALWPVRRPIAALASVAVQPLRPVASHGFELYAWLGPTRGDGEVFRDPEMKAMFLTDILMATKYGLRGPIYDCALFGRPWEFSPRDVRVPVRIWHGDIDPVVPLSHSEFLASVIPDAKLEVVPGLGHFAGFVSAEAVLDEIDRVWHRPRLVVNRRA